MALKRLPVLFFCCRKYEPKAGCGSEKGCGRGGEWNGKKRTQKSVALEICM